MSASVAAPASRRRRPWELPPTLAIARELGRRALRSGAGWGLVFGIYVLASAKGYAAAYPTAAERHALATSFGSNAGLAALVGKARDIDTVAGFTAWRCIGVLSMVGAVWGLLAGTRLLRGEEDAGRWELLLAGQTTRRRAAAQGLAALAAGWLALWYVTALLCLASGRAVDPQFAAGDALFLATALAASAALFLVLGAFAGQIAATRRQAATIAGAVFGGFLVLRMAADTGSTLDFLRWFTPLGWIEEMHPLTGAEPLLLLPVAGLTAILAALTLRLAGRRDLGASVIAARDTAPTRTRLLHSPATLALRLMRPAATGWLAGTALYGLLLGLIAKTAITATAGSKQAEEALRRLGAPGFDAKAFLGVEFILVAATVCLIACGQVVATREEEAEGRLDNLLVRPLARWRWLAGRLGASSLLLVACGLIAGAATWAGAVAESTSLSFASGLAAGVNTVPPALFVLGLGALVQSVAPRWAGRAMYGLVAWSFLLELIGSLIEAPKLVLDTSLLHHLAPAPATQIDGLGAIGFVVLGAVAAVLAALLLQRRDLAGA